MKEINQLNISGIIRSDFKSNERMVTFMLEQNVGNEVLTRYAVVCAAEAATNFNSLGLHKGDRILITNALVYEKNGIRLRVTSTDQIYNLTDTKEALDLGTESAAKKFIG